MIKYPSIEQFRNVIRELRLNHDYKGKDENGDAIYLHDTPYPTLTFKGTVKLHGTNAGIVKYKNGDIKYQSRERELSLTSDNAGFMLSMMNKNIDFLFDGIEFNEYIAVFGEWCGQSIQKGVALSQLPKMFVVFGFNIDGNLYPAEQYADKSDVTQSIYNINDFPYFEIDIDFNQPELSQNKLIELTLGVEEECPVGKFFGISGVGEGIVFHTFWNNKTYQFKSKGEKHSVSKVTKLNAIDTVLLEGINTFVDLSLTENRLLQGIDKLKEKGLEINQLATGEFLRWVVGDVLKEEQDTIIENQFDVKKVSSTISSKAKVWFFNYFNTNV